MTIHEITALGHFTCEYPQDKTFEEVLELIENESDDVTIWEPFENDFPESVIEKINDMVGALESAYGERADND